jgi:predicted alpha-1,2-mannosidase
LRSIELARRYAETEIVDFDFARTQKAATMLWEAALGTIRLAGATSTQERLFYTALYQSFLMPRDRTGDNPNWTSDLPYWDDQYATWDTWRTKFPLMALIRPAVVRDNVMSLCDRLEHQRHVADSFVAGGDGPKQGGDDIDEIIAEARATAVPGIDWARAYAVLEHDAKEQRYPEYLAHGWIPEDGNPIMTCSNTLECAYNDFTSASVADSLGHHDDAAKWRKRSRQWEHLWDSGTVSDGFAGFIRPRRSNGRWVDFDAKRNYGSWKSFFYEANSWTYSLFGPHDFARLIQLCGGPDRFAARVDHAFTAGLVELANEPSFMAARAFNYAGRPDRNAFWTHKVMAELYSLDGGYPGNDDSGAMGSWYVFSALGFFPNAGQGVYLVNGPFCRRIELTLGNGKSLTIEAANVSQENIYVQSMKLNGNPWAKNWFSYSNIKDGAQLEFVMGPKPSNWGTLPPFAPSLSDP